MLITSGNFTATATGINSTAIGADTASSGAFTTLSSTGNTTLGSGAGSTFLAGNTTGAVTLTAQLLPSMPMDKRIRHDFGDC